MREVKSSQITKFARQIIFLMNKFEKRKNDKKFFFEIFWFDMCQISNSIIQWKSCFLIQNREKILSYNFSTSYDTIRIKWKGEKPRRNGVSVTKSMMLWASQRKGIERREQWWISNTIRPFWNRWSQISFILCSVCSS